MRHARNALIMTVLRVVLFIAPAFLCLANAGERRAAEVIIIKTSPFLESPGPASGTATEEFIGEGNVGRVVESRRGWKRIQTDKGTVGWVRSEALGAASQFRRVYKWPHPELVEVGDGDYWAAYRFKSDGRFVLSDYSSAADPTRLVWRKGRMYVFGSIVWSRVGQERPSSSRMFLKHGGKLCWEDYANGRCP